MLEKKLEAVFISDLHLHPNMPEISQRFYKFLDWAKVNTSKLYILGDFFHVWPGDDSGDKWSDAIAEALYELTKHNTAVYFMHGNRDFLLGNAFAKKANMTLISEPSVIKLGNSSVVLAHGDQYCVDDKSHQKFRKLTRNKLFSFIFLKIPLSIRIKLAQNIRNLSQRNRSKSLKTIVIPSEILVQEMKKHNTNTLIHGHIHQPGLINHESKGETYLQYVLSDWDEIPVFLCYDNTKGLFFYQIN